MLAYAANRPRVGARQSSPNAMLFVICAHIIVIAVVLSARMTMPPKVSSSPVPMISVPLPKAPPPRPDETSQMPRAPTPIPVPRPERASDPMPTTVPMPPEPDTSEAKPLIGGGAVTIPYFPPRPPQPLGVTSGAELLTPPSELKPPYPEAKLLTGEEASLTLRLSIDENGRVIAVDPVGRFDPVFLAAARRHLLAHWRYKPAIKDGRATASTTLVTLRFELDS